MPTPRSLVKPYREEAIKTRLERVYKNKTIAEEVKTFTQNGFVLLGHPEIRTDNDYYDLHGFIANFFTQSTNHPVSRRKFKPSNLSYSNSELAALTDLLSIWSTVEGSLHLTIARNDNSPQKIEIGREVSVIFRSSFDPEKDTTIIGANIGDRGLAIQESLYQLVGLTT